MKIEKNRINGCKALVAVDKLPARLATVGGSTYAEGTTLTLGDEVAEMEAISKGGKTWFGVPAEVNGSITVVGINTLLGVYFDESKQRQTKDNGINQLAVKDMLGLTIKVVSLHDFKTMSFVSEEDKNLGKESVEISRKLPIFEICKDETKAPKKEKVK